MRPIETCCRRSDPMRNATVSDEMERNVAVSVQISVQQSGPHRTREPVR